MVEITFDQQGDRVLTAVWYRWTVQHSQILSVPSCFYWTASPGWKVESAAIFITLQHVRWKSGLRQLLNIYAVRSSISHPRNLHCALGLEGACHYNSGSVVKKANVSLWKYTWKTSPTISVQSRIKQSWRVREVDRVEVNFAARNKSFTVRK